MIGSQSPIPLHPEAVEHQECWYLDITQLRDLDALSARLLSDLGLGARLQAICDFWVPARAKWIVISLHDPVAGADRVAAAAHCDPGRSHEFLRRVSGEVTAPTDRFFQEPGIAEISLLLTDADRRVGMLHVGIEPVPAAIVDQAFARCVAARCGAALSNSQQYEAQLRVAQAFQSAALEVPLPVVPGIHFDALYEAGRAEALIGGDWYDAFQVQNGRIILSIGDVCGSGLDAAISMMNVRQAIRGIAQVHSDPGVMLAAAERTLLLQQKNQLVTALVMVLDPVTQQCSYASAGHPPAFLRTSDGVVHQLSGTRFPLGLDTRHGGFTEDFTAYHAALPPDSILLLYTDGLTESTRNVIQGEAALRAALSAPETLLFDNPARFIHDRVLGTRSSDDVAMLTVRFEAAKEVLRWRFDPMWSDAAQRVRAEICVSLRDAGFSHAGITCYEMIFSELMSNINRYAPGTADVILEKHSGEFVLHILDKGPGFAFIPRLPADLFSEFGRGLFLVANLALNFSVEHRPGGGSHARVVLPKNPNGAQQHADHNRGISPT